MALTPVEEIRRALKEAYDPEYYASLYRQTRYAFGEKYGGDEGIGASADGEFPDFAPIRVRQLAIGQSRRILTSQFIDLARNMYSPGDPEFPDVDKLVELVRKGFFLRRSEEGEWDSARCSGFLEGNGVGVGFLQGGRRKNPATGKSRVHLRHSPTYMTLWDPHEASAGRAGYVCFVQNLPVNRGIALYGTSIEEHAHDVESGGRTLRTVRIFEYYDLGHGRWDATMAIIPGKMSNDPIKRLASPWKEKLPFAFYEHLLPPGMSRPIGRIPLMMPTQEAINELEAYLRSAAKKRPVDVIDPTFVDPQDLVRVENGTSNVLRTLKPMPAGQRAMDRIPAEPISSTAMELLQILTQQFNEDSGTTEYDRGGKPEGALTAYEVNSIQSATARQGGWSDKQSGLYARRTVELVEMVAAEVDDDPFDLSLLGHQIPFNDPKAPASSIAKFVSIPSRVLVDEETLRRRDFQQEGATRIQQLQALNAPIPLVGQVIDPRWYGEEMLRAIGEQNPETALLNGPAQGATGAPPTGPDGAPAGPQGPQPGVPAGAPAAPPQPLSPP